MVPLQQLSSLHYSDDITLVTAINQSERQWIKLDWLSAFYSQYVRVSDGVRDGKLSKLLPPSYKMELNFSLFYSIKNNNILTLFTNNFKILNINALIAAMIYIYI